MTFPTKRIRTDTVEYSLKLSVLLKFLFCYIFSHMLTVIHIDMQHYRGPFLFYYVLSPMLIVTPIGSSTNAGTSIMLQQKIPNNRI